MSHLFLIVIFLLTSTTINAQEFLADFSYKDLKDRTYIYSLDDDGYQARNIIQSYTAYANTRYCSAILVGDKLYKNVNFNVIYPNSGLRNYEYKLYTKPKKIQKFTNDPDVVKLYVIGKERTKEKEKK